MHIETLLYYCTNECTKIESYHKHSTTYLDDAHESLVDGELLLELVEGLLHVALSQLQVPCQQAVLLLLLLLVR